VVKKVATKKAPVKKAATKKKAVARRSRPKPPVHPLKLNGKEWDRDKTTRVVFSRLANSALGLGQVLDEGYEEEGKKYLLPDYSTIMDWIGEDNEIAERYARAHEAKAEFLGHEYLEIVDNVGAPVMVDGKPLLVDGKPIMAVTNEAIQHARLRADSRKWLMGKLKPKKYGDRVQQDVNVYNHEAALAELE